MVVCLKLLVNFLNDEETLLVLDHALHHILSLNYLKVFQCLFLTKDESLRNLTYEALSTHFSTTFDENF